MRRGWWVSVGLGVFAHLATSARAVAGDAVDFNWCVGDLDPTLDTPPCGDADFCSNDHSYPTAELAVAAAREAGSLSSSPGDDHHQFCVWNSGPLSDTFEIDNSDGLLGDRLSLAWMDLNDTPLCRPALVPATTPLITVIGPTASKEYRVSFRTSQFDPADCPDGGARVYSGTNTTLEVSAARFLGGPGPAFEVLNSPDQTAFAATGIRIEGFEGPALVATGSVEIAQSEINSNHSIGVPVVQVDGRDFVLRSTIVHGNVAEGAPLLGGSAVARLEAAHVQGNVVLDGSLLQASPGLNEAGPDLFVGIRLGSLAENTLWSGGSAEVAPVSPRDPGDQADAPFCLPQGAQSRPLQGRDAASTTGGEPSNHPLIALNPRNTGAGSDFAIVKVFAVDNAQAAGAPIVLVAAGSGGLRLSFINNTISASAGVALVGGSPDQSSLALSGLTTARNLFLSDLVLGGDSGWDAIESSMDFVMEGDVHPAADATTAQTLYGPILSLTEAQRLKLFELETETALWSNCALLTAACSAVDFACEQLSSGGGNFACPLGAAKRYLPSASGKEWLESIWPWEGDWFDSAPWGPDDRTAGATGWSCNRVRGPWDRASISSAMEGDNDGFTLMVDCANENPNVLPALPPKDGHSSQPCREELGVCYRCPDGSGPDDDDSAQADDDDEAPAGDDEDSSKELPTAPSDCAAEGCGLRWSGLPAFALFGAAGTRRRRTRP